VNERPRRSNLFRLIGSLIILVFALTVFVFRQQLIDQYNVWSYHPSEEVARIADTAKLSPTGEFYFYTSHPEIDGRAAFNAHCTQQGEKTAILGCYASGRIYVFDVTDDRLNGIKEVTAAHEMLHAAYERLDDSEKQRINQLVENQLASVTDTRIKDLIELYDKTEPGERANELHSILGTEVKNLSPELEKYYSRYFKDRLSLVSLSQKYESIFTEINDEQNALVEELNSLAADITARSATYNSDTNKLNADITAFNQKASSGGFDSQAQFDAERRALLVRQSQLQAARAELNTMIAKYNTDRQKLETLNGQAEALNRSINSQLSPVPSI
jgi:hypothetical protein